MSVPERQDASPEVSVVVPSRGREMRLAFLLDALAEQTLESERFEVIVVRDGPPPSEKATAPDGLSVRFLDLEERVGPSIAREQGWRLARAPLIVFTDDDCRPAPDWLERVLAAWVQNDEKADVILQGRTEPDPDERHLLVRLARSQEITEPSPFFQCCNIAYPRELLDRIGGFDEEFAFGGEDTDVGLRAMETGARQVYVDDAVVWHAVHPRGLGEAVRGGLAWETIPVLVARHPQLRAALIHRLFWKAAHERWVLAALGAALARPSRGLSLLAVLPYMYLHWDRRERPTPRRVAGFAAYLAERSVADGAEVAGTAWAALRYRTPML